MPQQMLTLEEAAQRLGISPDEMKRRLKTHWAFKGLMQIRDGATVRFKQSAIEEVARALGLAKDSELPPAPAPAPDPDVRLASDPPRRWITLDEAAEILGITPDEMKTRLRSDTGFKQLRQIRDGATLKFRSAEVEALADELNSVIPFGEPSPAPAAPPAPPPSDPPARAVPGYVLLEEAAAMLGISPDELKRRLKSDADFRQLRAFQDRGLVRFRLAEIEAFVRARENRPASPPPGAPVESTRGQTPADRERLSSGAAAPGAASAAPPGTPAKIGRFEVRGVLGSGTFGRVYRAFDPGTEREVAIKMPILPPESHRAFLREARAIADIHHPNVCPVYEVGPHEGLPYIVMRYVKDGTLEDVLAREPLSPEKALRMAGQIANGLEEAHAHGVFHRDLKPANVLFDEKSGKLLLTDFGVARLADSSTATTGGIKGTPLYMAPEQWDPDGMFGPITARTDVYSLGVMLFRLLTGAHLFNGTAYQLMTQHCQAPPRKPSAVHPVLDTRLDDLVLKALAKQPADRYASAKAFADAIAGYLRTPAPPREQKWQITVPGTWYSRSDGGARWVWKEVATTPAEITIQAGEVYKLSLSSAVSNADLAALMPLARLTALHTLSLKGCTRITDAGLTHLKELTALQSLSLSWCEQVTGAGLVHLKELSALSDLSLKGCVRIVDADLAHLKGLPALRELYLRGLQITDAGLAHLKGFNALQTLSLKECERITDAGVVALQQALPNCEISR